MTRERLDGLMVTSEPNLEYLSGFVSQFPWNSPSRPWYFVLPRVGEAAAVIPEIGETLWRQSSWAQNIQTWPSPRPENEGLDLSAAVVGGMKRRFGRLGVELGPESRLGMPVADLLRLRRGMRPLEMVDCIGVMRELRLVKSPPEVARIRHICQIACDGFDALPSLIAPRDTEKDVIRKFQADVIMRGADKTPYVMTRSGRNGYTSIIAGPTDRRLGTGDILIIDTGCTYDGYFCDFDRNIAIGEPAEPVKRAQELLFKATSAGIKAARPGNTSEDVFRAQAKVLEDAGERPGNVGRFGHGLGKKMTEPPSNKPGDRTKLVPGVVLTIEPSVMWGRDKILVHEENLVVTEGGCRLLTRRAPREMPVVTW